MTSLRPLRPPLATLWPPDPIEDLLVPAFASGGTDPDGNAILVGGSPLVFYQLDGPETIRLSKTPAGEIRIEY